MLAILLCVAACDKGAEYVVEATPIEGRCDYIARCGEPCRGLPESEFFECVEECAFPQPSVPLSCEHELARVDEAAVWVVQGHPKAHQCAEREADLVACVD